MLGLAVSLQNLFSLYVFKKKTKHHTHLTNTQQLTNETQLYGSKPARTEQLNCHFSV